MTAVAVLLQCGHKGAQYKLMRCMFTLKSSGCNMLRNVQQHTNNHPAAM